MGEVIDMTGKRVNNLTVIRRVADHIAPDGKRYVMWECVCDCGKIIITRGTALRGENAIRSCGCLRIKNAAAAAKNRRKHNKYDLSGSYGIGYTSNTNKEFYFDLEDYDKIKDYCWHEGTGEYILASIPDSKSKLAMHRLLMLDENDLCNKDIDVDHKNGHGSRNDNRKCNLRVATRQQNMRNKTSITTNTSGFIGVSFRKDRNKWRAYINTDKGNQLLLGHYNTFTEAVKARIEGELKYFGEFAYSSHKNVLEYINNGGILKPYNREQIENIMSSK